MQGTRARVLVPAALPAWRDSVFIAETAERLLLGQILARPERWPLVRVGVDHFNSSRRTLFRLLVHLAARAIPFDRERVQHELEAAGVEPRFADDLAREWAENPQRLRDLEDALELRHLRRRVNVGGEALIEVARDPGSHMCVLGVTTRHVLADLADVVGRVEGRL